MICPFYKKGNQLECKNYRGIVFLNLLLERLRPYAEKCIGTYQAGFRMGRFTIDQIFALRQILEKTRKYNIDTYHLFIDF